METLKFTFSPNEVISEGYESIGSPSLLSDGLTSSSPENQFPDFELDDLFNLPDHDQNNGTSVHDHEYCLQENNNISAFEQNFDFSTIDTNLFNAFHSDTTELVLDPQTEIRELDVFGDLSSVTMQLESDSPNTSEESFQNFESLMAQSNSAQGTLIVVPVTNQIAAQRPQCTILTEDEQALLAKEGIHLPVDVPLTRDEERILKVVRRKIRNKISAKVSRMKKQSYVEGLEQRVKICTQQNKELQVKVEKLQKQNLTLALQLKKLQGLLFQPQITVIARKRQMQAGGCLMVLLLSFALFIFPSMVPWLEDHNMKMSNDLIQSSLSTGRKILQEPSLLRMDYIEEYGTSPKLLLSHQKSFGIYDAASPHEDYHDDQSGEDMPEQYTVVLESHNHTSHRDFEKTDL